MKKILKAYFAKIRVQALVRKLVRLTSDAYDVNKSIQASDLPDVVKARSSVVLDTYVDYCAALGLKKK